MSLKSDQLEVGSSVESTAWTLILFHLTDVYLCLYLKIIIAVYLILLTTEKTGVKPECGKLLSIPVAE